MQPTMRLHSHSKPTVHRTPPHPIMHEHAPLVSQLQAAIAQISSRCNSTETQLAGLRQQMSAALDVAALASCDKEQLLLDHQTLLASHKCTLLRVVEADS